MARFPVSHARPLTYQHRWGANGICPPVRLGCGRVPSDGLEVSTAPGLATDMYCANLGVGTGPVRMCVGIPEAGATVRPHIGGLVTDIRNRARFLREGFNEVEQF